MSSQPSLISVALDSQVQRPSSYSQWQFFRDTAAAGSGSYYAMNKDGVKESICCGAEGSTELFIVSFNISNQEILSLNSSPKSVDITAQMNNRSAFGIVQAHIYATNPFTTPYTMTGDNVLSFKMFKTANYPLLTSDILSSSSLRLNQYNPINGSLTTGFQLDNVPITNEIIIDIFSPSGGAVADPQDGDYGLQVFLLMWAYIRS